MKQEALAGMLVSYKNRQRIKDDCGNEVVMFFNENFLDEIMPLMSSFRHHKMSRQNENDTRKVVVKHGIVQIKESLKLLETNYKLNVIKFIEYGQDRKKNWDYMQIEQYNQQKHIIPKPKKKFMNLKNRSRYVVPK